MEAKKQALNNEFKKVLLPLFLLVFFMSCGETNTKKNISETSTKTTSTKLPVKKLEVKTFQNENGWGYDIFRNGKRYIHQPSKPAVGGTNGFDTKLQAQKFGELVVYKIEKGIIPPTVSIMEVDSIIDRYK